MKIWNYKSYEAYKGTQVRRYEAKKGNRRPVNIYKHNLRFVLESDMTFDSAVCHGIRNENEMKAVGSLLDIKDVHGTDIGFTSDNPLVLTCDFSDLPEEWEKRFDLTYSNALDHAMDPNATIKEWIRCTRRIMVLELSTVNISVTDPVSFEDEADVEAFMERHGLTILDLTHSPERGSSITATVQIISS